MAEQPVDGRPTKFLFRLDGLDKPDLEDRLTDFLNAVVKFPLTIEGSKENDQS